VNKLHLPPRNIFPVMLAVTVLALAILSCGAGAPGTGEEQPVASQATQPAPEEPSEEQPPTIIDPVPQPTFSLPATSVPAIPEKRRLTLEFPEKIRVGDADIVRLTLEVDDLGNVTPTAVIEGNVVTGEVIEIPNLYETHHVIVESKFDVAGLQVSPAESISQTLSPGQTLNFFWSVRPQETGVYRGTLWLFLHFVDKLSGEESRKTVSAQIVEIEAVNFFGLSANLVRGMGAVGSVVGTVVGFPFFEDIVKFIFKRRGRVHN